MVHPLTQQLNGRLGKVLLPLRHVQVIHKDDILLACRRPKHTLHAQNNIIMLLFQSSNQSTNQSTFLVSRTHAAQGKLSQQHGWKAVGVGGANGGGGAWGEDEGWVG